MKRLLSLLLSVGLLFSQAFAVPEMPYAPETLLVYHTQPKAVQKVIDLLYAGAMNCETEISMPPGTRYNDVDQAWIILQNEFPELMHLSSHARIVYFQNAPDFAISALLEYTVTADEFAAMYDTVMAEAQKLAASAVGTDYERELYLHDAVAARASYSENVNGANVHNIYGALIEGDCVCEGYAQALTLLCRLAGIPCSMLIGQAGVRGTMVMHGWNVMEIEGVLLLTDVTYNDHNDDMPVHWYFNLPAQDMAATHHTDAVLPVSDGDAWLYTRMNGGYVDDASQLQAVFDAQYARMQETGIPMEIRAADDELFRLLLSSLGMFMRSSVHEVGVVTYSTSEALRTITLTEMQE